MTGKSQTTALSNLFDIRSIEDSPLLVNEDRERLSDSTASIFGEKGKTSFTGSSSSSDQESISSTERRSREASSCDTIHAKNIAYENSIGRTAKYLNFCLRGCILRSAQAVVIKATQAVLSESAVDRSTRRAQVKS